MIVVNTETVPGYEIVALKGLVQGNTVRAKHAGRDIAAGFKNLVGGEIKGYTELLTESRREATSRMMQQAEQDAKNKVSETEVLGIAREKSHEIIKKAEDRSREMYRVANEYTEDALRRTEEAIQMALEEVKQSRVRFRAASAEQMQKRREELAQSAEKQTQNG